jgi:hypothetical protein
MNLMTPKQKALYGRYEMLRADACGVEKQCGGNSNEMEKKRDQVAAALAEYVNSLQK